MWENIIIGILVCEGLIFLGMLYTWFCKKKTEGYVLFMVVMFIVNFAVYFLPLLYEFFVENQSVDWVVEGIKSTTSAFLAFMGEGGNEKANAFTKTIPLYRWAYVAGYIIAPLASIYTALQAFSYTIKNKLRVFFLLKKKNCDIILGTSENALRYAKNGAAIVIPEDKFDKDGVMRLVEQGYVILHRSFSKELLNSAIFNGFTRYNIICTGNDKQNLQYTESFIAFREKTKKKRKFHLFVEIDSSKATVIRKEIIDKCCCKDAITTYCANELLARRFTAKHPLTEYMPRELIDEATTAIKPESVLNVIYVGFGERNREMYRQSVMNNQFVMFDGEHKCFAVNYYLYDEKIDQNDWIIDGLKTKLEEMGKKSEKYFKLPLLPYNTVVENCTPYGDALLEKVEQKIQGAGTFSSIIVDTGDTYKNIETGTELRTRLGNDKNYHIFIRTELTYTENDDKITYIGDYEEVFTHDIIVNDSLSKIAYKLNEIYTAKDTRQPIEAVKEKAAKDWAEMDYFTRYSNLYAALNLRFKLHLLGLDFVKLEKNDGFKENNVKLLEAHYAHKSDEKAFDKYFVEGRHNALLAQEKYRWNAYHLLNGVLPRAIDEVVFEEKDGKWKPTTKNSPLTKHACITTFKGIEDLAKYLASEKSKVCKKEVAEDEFNYCKYDDQLLNAVVELMGELGYSLIEKKNENTETTEEK